MSAAKIYIHQTPLATAPFSALDSPGLAHPFIETVSWRARSLQVCDLQLQFFVSSNEEHVELRVAGGDRILDMGARAHHYLLLTLARRRLADAADGWADTAAGWLDLEELEHDVTLAPYVNLHAYRIRRQFAAVGVVDAYSIIQRRMRARQIRIGAGHLSIASL